MNPQGVLLLGIIGILALEYHLIMQLQVIAPRIWGALLYLTGNKTRLRDYLYVKTWFRFGGAKADQFDAELTRLERKRRQALT